MRTRSKLDPISYKLVGPWTFEHQLGGVVIEGPIPSGSATYRPDERSSEVIIDDPGPSRGVKSVSHVKRKTVWHSINDGSYYVPAEDRYFHLSGASSGWYSWFGASSGYFDIPEPPTGESVRVEWDKSDDLLVRDAVHAFYTGQNETSGLEAAIEAPGLKSSLASLLASVSTKSVKANILKSLYIKTRKGYVQLVKRSRKEQLKALAKASRGGSGLYLFYSFAIAPLVSDIRKVASALKTLKSDMQKAKSSSGKPVSIHRNCNGSLNYYDIEGEKIGTSTTDGPVLWKLSPSTVQKIVTVRGTRSERSSNAGVSQLGYLLERFGASGPAALAWEFIPYSFVADWFLDLRGITDRLDNLITGGSKQILDICMSEKISYVNEGTFRIDIDGVAIYANGADVCSDICSSYTRSPVLTYNQIGLQSGRFGKKQGTYLGALIHQKMANLLR